MNEQELLNEGYKKYNGKDIDIFFNGKICEHAGNCVNKNSEVFNPERRPWVLPDNGNAKNLAKIIDTCPVGALKYILKP